MIMGFSAVTGGTPRKIHSIYASSFRHALRGREAVLFPNHSRSGSSGNAGAREAVRNFLGNWDVNLWDFSIFFTAGIFLFFFTAVID